MFRNQQQQQQPYYGKSGRWWTIGVFCWLALMTGNSIFWVLMIPFLIKQMHDINVYRKWQNVPSTRGPLEQRREEQMRKYDQIGGRQKPTRSPQAQVKANPYKESGMKKYKNFDLQDSIEDFTKGLAISPTDVSLHFNIACAYSLTEKKSKAFYHLSKAVSLGLKDVDKIMQHDDLAYVRIQPEFEAFRKSGFLSHPFGQETPPASNAEPVIESNNSEASVLANIAKLVEMRQKGILSDEEFVLERQKVLRQ